MKTIQDKKVFLEEKGIKVGRIEGDDFSTVFHLVSEDFAKVDSSKKDWEKELDCYIEISDMFGMSVVIIENKED